VFEGVYLKQKESNQPFLGNWLLLFLAESMSLKEFSSSDAVDTRVGDDQEIANIERSHFSFTTFIGSHPLIDATSNANFMVEVFCHFDAFAFFSWTGDQKKILLHVGKHVCQHSLFRLVGHGGENFCQSQNSICAVDTDRTDIPCSCKLGEFPAVCIRTVFHQQFSAKYTKYGLELGFIVDRAFRLFFGHEALPKHDSQKSRWIIMIRIILR